MYYNRAGTGVSAGVTGKATTIVFAKQDTQAKTVRKVSMRLQSASHGKDNSGIIINVWI